MQSFRFFLWIQFWNGKEDCPIITDKYCVEILRSDIKKDQLALHNNDTNFNIVLKLFSFFFLYRRLIARRRGYQN